MEFGICCSLEEAKLIDDHGFDFIEVNANNIASLSEEAYEEHLTAFKALKTPVKSTNVFFSGDMNLTGPDRNLEDILAYVEHTIKRASGLGAEVMVLGSGAARRFHPPMAYPDAIRQLIGLITKMADIAAKYKVLIVLEPLNFTETNLINSLAEGASFVAGLNKANIGLLADLFHMFKNEEPLEDLVRLAPVDHIHIATRSRKVPTTREEMEEILGAIRASGYNKRVSIEGGSDNYVEDTKRAVELFNQYMSKI